MSDVPTKEIVQFDFNDHLAYAKFRRIGTKPINFKKVFTQLNSYPQNGQRKMNIEVKWLFLVKSLSIKNLMN